MKAIVVVPVFSLAAVFATGLTASAQTGGTVNDVSQSEIAKAKAAIQHAGYQPEILTMAQDHNLFFNATKGGLTYGITVTAGGKVFAGTGLAAGPKS